MLSYLEPLPDDKSWWYIEVPRTGSSTMMRVLQKQFKCNATAAKHWPVLPPPFFLKEAVSVIGIRNPYSRALSCYQFFTVPGEVTFKQWLKDRIEHSFFDWHIEARPQAYWYGLHDKWDFVIRQEELRDDYFKFLQEVSPRLAQILPLELQRYNSINGTWQNRRQKRTQRLRPWENYFDQESKELTEKLYEEDFIALQPYYGRPFDETL